MNSGIEQAEISKSEAPLPAKSLQTPRVLQVGKFYPPHMGGIETHLQVLSEQLRKSLDLRVIVASNSRQTQEGTVAGVPVRRVGTLATLFSAPICPSMTANIRAAGCDIVHLHLPNPTAVMAYLASGHRGSLVVTYHSDTIRQRVLGPMFEPFLHALLRKSSAIIATSPDYLRTSSVLRAHSDRCHVIPYGIDLAQFQHCNPAAIERVRQQYGERLVISVGRLVYYKGFDYLIRAMAQVRGKLLIIGGGPLSGQLKRLASDLGVSEKVVFCGEIQNADIVPYYHAADVFALASVARSEAFGIVQIEAMAAGLPVVNTSLESGVPFVSLNEKTGLTVPPLNPSAMAGALNRLLDDPGLRRSFGQAGRLRAQQEFTSEKMAIRILSLYQSVLAPKTVHA
jgi:glycosyltransferase involved in cell wall biosynthesis